ncbi:MAG: DNA polymerase I [Chloroflexia bacterium]|nr:DNA polymerase I [Chloroflexia bacterium]
MSPKPQLVLIDGHALLYRAYYALPQSMVTSQGEQTNAIYGFLTILLKVLEEQKPEHVIICFDTKHTFRHDLYPEYKAHRAKMPDDLRAQEPRLEQVLQALGLPTYVLDGYEADDLIGTLARQASEAGLETLVVTGDADILQLVTEQVHVLTPGQRYSDTTVYDPAQVQERYGFGPEQLVEYKALRGDPSDNIPGVPGVGDKTATSLVQKYDTLEKVYENLELVPSRYRGKLEEHREQAFFSRDLATIRTDAPVELDLQASRLGDYDREQVLQLFQELEFRSLLRRLPQAAAPSAAPGGARQLSFFEQSAAEAETPPDYVAVRDEAGLAAMLDALGRGPLAFDVETDSLRPLQAQLVGLSLAIPGGQAWYVPLMHKDTEGRRLSPQLEWPLVRERLAPLLGNPDVPKYAHNAKFDILVLSQHGLEVRGLASDTMIAAHLLEPGSVGLKDLAFRHLGVQMREIKELIGSGKSQITFDQVPLDEATPYACADADMTCRLQQELAPRLRKEGLQQLFADLELPLIGVLLEMERAGILVDVDMMEEMSRGLETELDRLGQNIQDMAGHEFNVNSTQQLSQVLFEELGLPLTVTRRLKTGSYSTASDVLENLRDLHPIAQAMLDYRELAKLKSTYVDTLPALVNPQTGRIHTSFHQTATSTGRLSSSDPNLQNIPVRSEIGRRVRRAFVAAPGCLLLSADYSQVELRVLAHLAQDPGLLQAFAAGEDIHASTAATLFEVALDEVSPEQRRLAKAVNFGLMYGMSEFGLAQRMGIERAQAAHFIQAYFSRYPRVQQYLEQQARQGRELGYVSTLLGRRRYIPELTSSNRNVRQAAEREAVNAPIQGTAADIIKIAMLRLQRALQKRGLGSRMLLQVHDELVLEVPEDELGITQTLVTELMESAYALDAPLKVDVHVGSNWGVLK